MTKKDAKACLRELQKAFHAVDLEKETFWIERCARLKSPALLKKAIDFLIEDEGKTDTFIPNLNEILKAYARAERESRVDRLKPYCPACGGAGVLVFVETKDGRPRRRMIRCSCAAGDLHKQILMNARDVGFPDDEAFSPANRIPRVKVEDLLFGPEETFDGTILMGCRGCGSEYGVDFGRALSRAEIAAVLERARDTSNESSGAGLCPSCYIQKGREHGYWS